MNGLVLREDSHGVVTLTLNRPDKRNALSREMFEDLEDHIDSIARDIWRIGLVVLRGAGGTFSAGYDMEEVSDSIRAHAKPHYQFEVIEKLADLPQPVISAVQGLCSTGALELALAADLIVASESAQFSDVYARWGLTPIWGLSLRLPRRIGSPKARELIYTCRTVSGVEAKEIHLANFCYPDDRFEAELAALAQQVISNSWYSNRVNKRVLIETDDMSLREAHGLEMFKHEGVAPDAEQRVAEFFKRPKSS
ncbi:MAG: enoyl-CoA hydratase/isomerase family protein [Stellaceae bacterium]